MKNQFALDVLEGLNATPKTLPSKYFYDKKGGRTLPADHGIRGILPYTVRIRDLPKPIKSDLLEVFANSSHKFNLVEFGAGDGYKTKVLLKHFLSEGANFRYVPIDISGNVLRLLEGSLKEEIPGLEVQGIKNDYFKAP